MAKKMLTLGDLQATAQAKGGECLSEGDPTLGIKPRWRCSVGHEWSALANNVRQNTWCPVCALARRRLDLSALQSTAQSKGGECLSRVYLGALAKHRWRCADGHEWDAMPANVRHGTWCPECAHARRADTRRLCA